MWLLFPYLSNLLEFHLSLPESCWQVCHSKEHNNQFREPTYIVNAPFHSSSSLILTLLNLHLRSILVNTFLLPILSINSVINSSSIMLPVNLQWKVLFDCHSFLVTHSHNSPVRGRHLLSHAICNHFPSFVSQMVTYLICDLRKSSSKEFKARFRQ